MDEPGSESATFSLGLVVMIQTPSHLVFRLLHLLPLDGINLQHVCRVECNKLASNSQATAICARLAFCDGEPEGVRSTMVSPMTNRASKRHVLLGLDHYNVVDISVKAPTETGEKVVRAGHDLSTSP